MNVSMERATLDFKPAMQVIGVSETTGRKLVREGRLPVIRIGRRVVIARRVIDEILSGERDLNSPHDSHM